MIVNLTDRVIKILEALEDLNQEEKIKVLDSAFKISNAKDEYERKELSL